MSFHFCAQDLQAIMGIIQQVPDLFIMAKHYLENIYYSTCNKCRMAIATLNFRNTNDHTQHKTKD